MNEPLVPFPWDRFFIRIIDGLTIVVMWALGDFKRHDFIGVAIALLVGAGMAISCYFWVRPKKTVPTRSNA